jgi:protein-L-isoaspartate(D-aspartate) O-methyltransferase
MPIPFADSPDSERLRAALVDEIAPRIDDARVVAAMRAIPRHLFVDAPLATAYGDHPVPIGHDQTISQPTIVAVMSGALELGGAERVLEIGTGSGYQAAVLSRLAREVFSIELVPSLAVLARRHLDEVGCANVHVRVGDGYQGWPDEAPFDRIILTAAPAVLPGALVEQLAEGGVLVAPVGAQGGNQRLLRLRRRGAAIATEDLGAVVFVPMVHGREARA